MQENKASGLSVGFVLEHSLGHTTHVQNLKRVLESRRDICPSYIDVRFDDSSSPLSRLPGVRSNWSLRASLLAYLSLHPQAGSLQALLFHTQVTSLLSVSLMRRIPSVISMDATPVQIDAMSSHYDHRVSSSPRLEAFKKRLNVRAFIAARHLIAWSEWTKDSLIADYGVPSNKISVIPPGIDVGKWHVSRPERKGDQPFRLLFVGGDFIRKGGDTLLEALESLPPSLNVELHLVTNAPEVAEDRPGVCIHRDVSPNSTRIRSLYEQSDLFILPTKADCLPLAVLEALASGLPVITTAIGALSEAVTHGESGWIVPAEDSHALAEAITLLAENDDLRLRLSIRAREVAIERFSAAKNYNRLLDTVKSVWAKG